MLISNEEKPLLSIHRLSQFNLAKYINPVVHTSHDLDDLFHNIEEIVIWWKSVESSFNIKVDKILINLLAFLDQLDVNQAVDISRKLVLTNMYAEALKSSKTELSDSINRLKATDKPSLIYKNLKQFYPEVLLYSMAKFRETKDKVSYYLTQLRNIKHWVNGNDLKKLGYPEGPLYAQILDKTFSAQLDGLITDKSEAINFIKNNFSNFKQV